MKNNAPSRTANIVARNLALVAATAETAVLVSSATADLNALFVKAFSRSGARFLKKSRRRWFQKIFRFYERLTIPGLAAHQALRKLHIERAVRTSLANGYEQVIILGGGYDALALKLHREFPQVGFFELDYPATQQVKYEAIENFQTPAENLYFLPTDFTTQTLAESLTQHPNYRCQAKSVTICEGVLMYLTDAEVDRIFDFVKKQTAEPRFIFTFMELDKIGKPSFRRSTTLVKLWLKWKNEPFKWGINKDELKDFLEKRDFALKDLATPEFFRRTYLEQFGLADYLIAEGENVCVCEINKASDL